MHKIAATIALLGVLATAGCDTSNWYGECQGLATEGDRDPHLRYGVSKWNVFLAIVFSETLLTPGFVGAFWLYCPTGPKEKPAREN